MSAHLDARAIADGLGAGAVVGEAHGEVTVDLPRERIVDACTAALAAGYDFLVDLAATDYLGYTADGVAGYWGSPTSSGGARDLNAPASTGLAAVVAPPRGERFAVSYQLLDRTARPARRLRLRVWAEDGEAVPSVVGVFPCADYQEREAWDLMGIPFDGHPALERIFLPEGWDGHPHRKDYPIGGEPVQFSDAV
jgi:NADH:ubiquinone oxidoreductase subunit C